MIDANDIFDQMLNPMVIVDTDCRIMFYNKMALLFGNLLEGQIKPDVSFCSLLKAPLSEQVKNSVAVIKREKKAIVLESLFINSRNDTVYFDLSFNPVLREDRSIKHITIIGRDITDQKIFERKSTALNKQITQLIENANAVIFSIDSQRYITTWNYECTRATGFSPDYTLARKLDDLVSGKHSKQFANALQPVLSGENARNIEIAVPKANGEHAVFLLNATPNKNNLNQVVGVLFIGQDITELSEYRQHLEKKVADNTIKLREVIEKEKKLVDIKNRFVSIASHEFKIPLSTIDTNLKLLAASPYIVNEDSTRLRQIETQVAQMKLLLEDVLTFEKTGAVKLKATLKPLNLIQSLRSLITEVMSATKGSHEIKTDFCSDTVMIDSDDKFLRNIFLNLLSNAIKYSPDADSIEVAVSESETGSIEVKIKDQGIGIPEQDREKIFEPFNRGSNCRKITGTGLGLSIVKRAADALNATIHLASEPDRGTTFTIQFPHRAEVPAAGNNIHNFGQNQIQIFPNFRQNPHDEKQGIASRRP